MIGLVMVAGMVVGLVPGCGSKFAKDLGGGFIEVAETFTENLTEVAAEETSSEKEQKPSSSEATPTARKREQGQVPRGKVVVLTDPIGSYVGTGNNAFRPKCEMNLYSRGTYTLESSLNPGEIMRGDWQISNGTVVLLPPKNSPPWVDKMCDLYPEESGNLRPVFSNSVGSARMMTQAWPLLWIKQ